MPPFTKQEKNDILNAGFKGNFIEIEKGIYTFKKQNTHACPYLTNEYSCGIQNVKPKLCKIWPVIPRYKKNKRTYILIKCPLFPSLSPQEIQQTKKEAATIPPRIITLLWTLSQEKKEKYKRFEYEEI
jgi:Fe-S-cluster containining protein